MDAKTKDSDSLVALMRERAEAKLARTPLPAAPERPREDLLHELQVYQIELEMQNDALRRAHLAMEESRDSYVELYEFAPVGYFTLTDKGLIAAANLTGATLLGVERRRLLGKRFDAFVRNGDRERWRRLFMDMLHRETSGQIELALQCGGNEVLYGRLDCRRSALGGVLPVLHLTLADVSELRRAEREAARQVRRIEALMQHAHDCVMMLDADTRIVAVSDSCLNTYGYGREELLAMKAADLRVPELRDTTPRLQSLKQPGSLSYRTWHCRKDGSRFEVEVGATMIELDGERSYQAIIRAVEA